MSTSRRIKHPQTFKGLIVRVLRALNRGRLEYAVTGALAVSYFGRPRTTRDINILVSFRPSEAERISSILSRAGLDVPLQALAKAWKSGYRITSFEDMKSLAKVDLILTEGKIERVQGTIFGIKTFFQRPEDIILAKARMIMVSQDNAKAENDRADIQSILINTPVDILYLKKEGKKQGTLILLDAMIQEVSSKVTDGEKRSL